MDANTPEVSSGAAKSTIEEKNLILKKATEVTVTPEELKNAIQNHVSKVVIPSIEDMFAAGVHFGHETKRWNPMMEQNIYTTKGGVHIIDLDRTRTALQKAVQFVSFISNKGQVVFVGTKRQSSKIVKEEAIRAGSFFVSSRWAGGLLTNFKAIQKSIKKLLETEKAFDEGVEGRTKYEVSLMKKEWQRLDRLYAGVKTMTTMPVAAIIVDAKYEKGAVRECRAKGIPVIALVDTNTNPTEIDYPIPCNDDAIKSIRLLLKTLADAVKEGNKGKEIVHNLKNYAEAEIAIVKVVKNEEEEEGVVLPSAPSTTDDHVAHTSGPKAKVSPKRGQKAKGILERVQEEREKKEK